MSDYMFQQLGHTDTVDLKTTVTESTITHTTTDPWGRRVEEIMDTKEKATRDALLCAGWLPPEPCNEGFMRKVKIYACCTGASAWGNGGEVFCYTDKESRDLKLKNAHIEDCPRGFEDDAVLIGGVLYWPPVKVKLAIDLDTTF